MKKLIAQIRSAKNWQEQSRIAENRMPGTPFDTIFKLIQSTNDLEKVLEDVEGFREIVAKNDAHLGRLVRQAVNEHSVHCLHDFATAVGQLRDHKSKPDYVLSAVTILGGVSAFECALDNQLRSIPIRDCEILWAPIPVSRKPKMDDIKKFIERSLGRKLTAEEWEKDSKKAERHMKALGYWEKFDHRGGRPKKTGTTKG
jgi:hypothetical protein